MQLNRIAWLFYLPFLLIAPWAMADNYGPPAGEFLYTASNQITGNAVVGYRVEADGNLTKLPGSPYATGGLGTGGDIFNQGGVVASANGRTLFVLNPASNSISVFLIGRDGRLTMAQGSPFPTYGITPISIAVRGKLLYVAHVGTAFSTLTCGGGCDLRGFRIEGGRLVPIPESLVTYPEPPSALPLAIAFTPDGRHLTVMRSGDDKIDMFYVTRKGLLERAPGAPFVSVGRVPLGFAFRPSNPSQLLVTNVFEILFAGRERGTVSPYLVAKTGQIAPIRPVGLSSGEQFGTCWIAFTSDGKYAYTTNTPNDTITSYEVAPDGVPTFKQLSSTPSYDNPFTFEDHQPLELVVTSNDKYLYAVLGNSAAIVGYEIAADGQLKALRKVDPVLLGLAGAAPFGLAYVRQYH